MPTNEIVKENIPEQENCWANNVNIYILWKVRHEAGECLGKLT
jgi:hypothetical protein